MQIDDNLAIGIGAVAASIVGALWIQVRSQISHLRSDLAKAIARIRSLEDDRAATAKDHADQLARLTTRAVAAQETLGRLVAKLIDALGFDAPSTPAERPTEPLQRKNREHA